MVSDKNRKERVAYSKAHEDQTIESFWQFVHFTDEAHEDPATMSKNATILREEGTAEWPENLQEMPNLKGIALHMSASVSWHHKSPLYFYKGEHNTADVRLKIPPKPRQLLGESSQRFQQRLAQWEALKPHDIEVKTKGNSITQQYYTDKLLPLHYRQIQAAYLHGRRATLQEDNDPSHGTKPNKQKKVPNVAQQFKNDHYIEELRHPAQSLDLNPCESVWNILFQRVRKEVWRTVPQLKQVLQQVWGQITLTEVRARIAETPARCQMIIDSGGKPVKSKLW